jgi:hypothetical protein
MRRTLRFAAALVLAVAAAPLAAHAKDPEKTKPAEQEPVCGRDLMTADEMAEHRAKMWSAKTPAERDAYRAEHHAQMVKRAQERGVTLDPAGCPGGGMGPGRGQGGPGWHRGGPPGTTPPPPSGSAPPQGQAPSTP